MKKGILILLSFFLSCKNTENSNEKSATNTPTVSKTKVQKKVTSEEKPHEKIREWLIESIENQRSMEEICTPLYAEFKSDAMGVDFDGGLSKEEFQKKWGETYNLELTNNESFMIGLQDFVKIKVSSADFLKETDNGVWFKLTISELYFNKTIYREVRIISKDNQFFIDEVLE